MEFSPNAIANSKKSTTEIEGICFKDRLGNDCSVTRVTIVPVGLIWPLKKMDFSENGMRTYDSPTSPLTHRYR